MSRVYRVYWRRLIPRLAVVLVVTAALVVGVVLLKPLFYVALGFEFGALFHSMIEGDAIERVKEG